MMPVTSDHPILDPVKHEQGTYSPKLSSAEAGKIFRVVFLSGVGGEYEALVRVFIIVILIVAAVVGYPVQGLAISPPPPPDLSDCSD